MCQITSIISTVRKKKNSFRYSRDVNKCCILLVAIFRCFILNDNKFFKFNKYIY